MEKKMDGEDLQENPVRPWKHCKDCLFQTLFCVLLIGRIGFVYCVIGVGLFKITFGILYLHDCKLQPLLPVYLIVEFCMALILSLHLFVCKSNQEDKSTRRKRRPGTILTLSITCAISRLVSVLLILFIFIWLIVGTVWVVTLREEMNAPGHCKTTTMIMNQTEISTTSAAIADCLSCNEILFYFTFGAVIAQWIFFGPIFAIFIGGILYYAVFICLIRVNGGYFEFGSESEDVETDSPIATPAAGV